MLRATTRDRAHVLERVVERHPSSWGEVTQHTGFTSVFSPGKTQRVYIYADRRWFATGWGLHQSGVTVRKGRGWRGRIATDILKFFEDAEQRARQVEERLSR